MRALLQRVSEAAVRVGAEETGRIQAGLLVLLGVGPQDSEAELQWLARKVCALRVFVDDAGKMNRSLQDTGGGLLVVSQFTLYADCRKGLRPSFTGAASAELARSCYERFCAVCAEILQRPVACGRFGADMQVSLVNDGPVTIHLESPSA